MDFAIFRRNLDEISPEFHRNGQEMTKDLEILKKCEKNSENFKPEIISGICAKFHSFISFFQSSPQLGEFKIQRLTPAAESPRTSAGIPQTTARSRLCLDFPGFVPLIS